MHECKTKQGSRKKKIWKEEKKEKKGKEGEEGYQIERREREMAKDEIEGGGK